LRNKAQALIEEVENLPVDGDPEAIARSASEDLLQLANSAPAAGLPLLLPQLPPPLP